MRKKHKKLKICYAKYSALCGCALHSKYSYVSYDIDLKNCIGKNVEIRTIFLDDEIFNVLKVQ